MAYPVPCSWHLLFITATASQLSTSLPVPCPTGAMRRLSKYSQDEAAQETSPLPAFKCIQDGGIYALFDPGPVWPDQFQSLLLQADRNMSKMGHMSMVFSRFVGLCVPASCFSPPPESLAKNARHLPLSLTWDDGERRVEQLQFLAGQQFLQGILGYESGGRKILGSRVLARLQTHADVLLTKSTSRGGQLACRASFCGWVPGVLLNKTFCLLLFWRRGETQDLSSQAALNPKPYKWKP